MLHLIHPSANGMCMARTGINSSVVTHFKSRDLPDGSGFAYDPVKFGLMLTEKTEGGSELQIKAFSEIDRRYGTVVFREGFFNSRLDVSIGTRRIEVQGQTLTLDLDATITALCTWGEIGVEVVTDENVPVHIIIIGGETYTLLKGRDVVRLELLPEGYTVSRPPSLRQTVAS